VVKGVATVTARPNAPVRVELKPEPFDVSGFLKALQEAGYSATNLVVVE